MRSISLGSVRINDAARSYINQIIKTKRLSYGPFSQQFEKKFARLHDVDHAILCNSGTSALQAILTAAKRRLNWPDEAEVLVPAVTFAATVNAVINSGLKPVLVEVDAKNYNIDPDLIPSSITKKTKAIMPVHLFGRPVDMDSIDQIAKEHDLIIIEDSCESIAAKYKKRSVGSWGLAAAFSLHSAHILTAGVGGVMTTSDPDLAIYLRSLIYHGRDQDYLTIDDDNSLSQDKLRQVVDKRFLFNEVGFSYRLSEFEAAIALSQLENIGQIVEIRYQNSAYLSQQLSDLNEFIQLPQVDQTQPFAFMAYPLVIKRDLIKRQPNLLKELVMFLEEQQIETRYFFPLLNQPAYEDLGWEAKDYPIASYLESAGFYVGCHQDLNEEDLDYVSRHIHRFFNKEIK